VPAGLVAVIWVSASTFRAAALVGLKPTSVAPVKPDPVMVTVSPPAASPLEGEMPVTAGPDAV